MTNRSIRRKIDYFLASWGVPLSVEELGKYTLLVEERPE